MVRRLLVTSSLTVGVEKPSAHVRRNTWVPLPGVSHMFVPGWLPRGSERFDTPRDALRNAVYVPRRPNLPVDVMHLWNRVSCGRKPWGVTFESTLPRGPLSPRVVNRLYARLTSSRCRFLIGMSDQALRRFAATVPDDVRTAIAAKVARVHPYQPVLSDSAAPVQPSEGEALRLLFIGRHFLRKGGVALLRAIDQVGDELDVRVTVVSPINMADYATRFLDDDHVRAVRQRVETHPRVTWLSSVSPAAVYRLAADTHVGLLPTLADTFGYSSLEMMSCGRPVITTNVEATTEVVNESVGWVIPLPLGHDGRWVGLHGVGSDRRQRYEEAIDTIADGLVAALRTIRASPESVTDRGTAALEHVRTRFGTERTQDLLDVYRRTCGDLGGADVVPELARDV